MDITCTLKNIHIWVGVGIHEIGWLDGLKEKVTFEERYEKGKRGLDLCLHRLVWILEGYSLSRLKRCGDVVSSPNVSQGQRFGLSSSHAAYQDKISLLT